MTAPALARQLHALADRLDELDPARVVGELEALKFTVCTASIPTPEVKTNGSEDRLLTVDEAAERLGMSVTWLYKNAARLPFTRRIGQRTVRFSATGITRYLTSRRTG